jgi:Site-specific recombinases, DNA invertase Pin homologs
VSRKPSPATAATGRLVGYARVSTGGQDLGLQLDALRAAGCAEIHEDRASGATTKRPGLDAALASLTTGVLTPTEN